uniref:Uncharacterized protein n=1 Tax=Timema bartmani TaxID=61472 RepID=A0A7R9ERF1_9NEOP|nr:unnamed protein product [Timema bartmani]
MEWASFICETGPFHSGLVISFNTRCDADFTGGRGVFALETQLLYLVSFSGVLGPERRSVVSGLTFKQHQHFSWAMSCVLSFKNECETKTDVYEHRDNFRFVEIARTESFQGMEFGSHISGENTIQGAIESNEKIVGRLNETEVKAPSKVYRTAYFIDKHDRPYSDHAELIQLQQLNGAVISPGLQSRFSATNMIDPVAREMKSRVCKRIIEINVKVYVIIEESTTASTKTTLIVYLKCKTVKSIDSLFFINLIELLDKTAIAIIDPLLTCLSTHGFDHTYLQNIFFSFTCYVRFEPFLQFGKAINLYFVTLNLQVMIQIARNRTKTNSKGFKNVFHPNKL